MSKQMFVHKILFRLVTYAVLQYRLSSSHIIEDLHKILEIHFQY